MNLDIRMTSNSW